MTSAKSSSELRGKIDFGIITIREDEFRAVLERCPAETLVTGRQRYAVSKIRTINEDDYLVASVRCIEQGNAQSQNVAKNLIEDLDPQWILLVGIAGSVPSLDYTLGDVILSSRLHDFCISASIENSNQQVTQQFSVAGGPMHPDVQKLLAHLPALEPFLDGWNSAESIKFSRPKISASPKNLFGDPEWQKKVRDSLRKYFGTKSIRKVPEFFTRPTASSDTLVKNTQLVSQWLDATRQIAGIEMELAGVYQAAWDSHKPVLAIRGISDVVGFKRSDEWTSYACHTAAAFTLALLRVRPISPASSEPVVVKSSIEEPRPAQKQSSPCSAFRALPQNIAPLEKRETLYSNLLTLTDVPKNLYTVTTECKNRGHVWRLLREQMDHPPTDWVYKGHTLYAFHDFSEPYWKDICELGTVEPNPTTHWSKSNDNDRLAEYVELLKGCLTQLGSTRDLYYLHKKPFQFLYYAPTDDLSPRIINTRSLVRPTGKHTVFQGYYPDKETKEFRYYRHHAFRFDFYRYEGEWYLEITPTYHYTTDGYRLYRYYEKLVRGIKKIETNEPVFRQVLFWSEVLRDDETNYLQQENKYPYLKFGELLHDSFPYGINDDVWLKNESLTKRTDDKTAELFEQLNEA